MMYAIPKINYLYIYLDLTSNYNEPSVCWYVYMCIHIT